VHATTKPLQLHILDYDVPLAPRPAAHAFVAEVRSMPVALQAWFGFLLAILAVMAVAAIVSIPPGWEVFGTTPAFEWGLMIIGYVFFAIMTSGLCLASSLGTVFGIERFQPFEKRHAILAVLSLTTAFLIIALDLHYPVRMVFGAVFVPSPSSPMWWMGVFYGVYLVVLLVEVWSLFTPHPKIHQYACTTAAVVAILAPFTLGAVFGVMNAKAYWFGIFTPILMVASAFLAGTALLGIVFYLVYRLRLADFERAAPIALPSVRLLLGVGLALVGALIARQVAAGLDVEVRGLREATAALLTGPLAPLFWLRIIGGLMIPAVLVVLPVGRRPEAVFAASILALSGILVDRFLFVAAGQVAPVSAGAGTLSYPYATYTPTPVEIAIIVGGGAFMALLYTLAERYLDMGETDTHVFFGFPWVKKRHEHDDEGDVADTLPEVLGPIGELAVQGAES
jgi:Ni/Fe-hydrogenase subunit HybB-like protein